MSSSSTLINPGDDPLSTNAAETTRPSTTPHLPKLEDIVRASLDYTHSASGSMGGNQQEDLEARRPMLSAADDSNLPKQRQVDQEEPSAGFEAPTKVEKMMMVTSIGMVLLFSVAAGMTTFLLVLPLIRHAAVKHVSLALHAPFPPRQCASLAICLTEDGEEDLPLKNSRAAPILSGNPLINIRLQG